jgi:hypothetical protein
MANKIFTSIQQDSITGKTFYALLCTIHNVSSAHNSSHGAY